MSVISNLDINVRGNVGNAQKGFKQLGGDFRDFKKDILSSGGISKFLGKGLVAATGAAAAGFVALGAAAAATGAGLVALSLAQFDYIGQTVDTADKIGIATDALMRLRHAAEQSGTPVGDLEKGLSRLRLNVSKATAGSEKLNASFAALGLSAAELNGLNSEQQFSAIAEALGKVANENDKARLATELFGRAGEKILLTTRLGANGLAELGREATRLGLVLSDAAARSVEEAGDQLANVKKMFKGIGIQLAPLLAPFVSEFSKIVIEAGVRFREFLMGFRPHIEQLFVVWKYTWEAAKGVATAALEATGRIFKPFIDLITNYLGIGEASFTNFSDGLLGLLNEAPRYVQYAGQVIERAISKVADFVDWIRPNILAVGNYVFSLFRGIYNVVSSYVKLLWAVWEPFISGVGTLIGGWGNAVEGLKGAHEGIYNTLASVFTGITGFIAGALDRVREFVTGFRPIIIQVFNVLRSAWEAIYNLTVAIWTAVANFITPIIQSISTAVSQFFGGLVDKAQPTLTSLADWFKWLKDSVLNSLIEIEFAIKNFDKVWEIAVASAALALVQFAENMKHIFMTVLPTAAKAYVTLQIKLLQTLVENASRAGKAIYEGLTTGQFNFDPLPIADLYIKAFDTVQESLQRKVTDTEKLLADDLEGKVSGYMDSLDEFRAKRIAELTGKATESIKEQFKFEPLELDVAINQPEIKVPDVEDIQNEVTAKLEAPKLATFGSQEALDIITNAQNIGRNRLENLAAQQLKQNELQNKHLANIEKKREYRIAPANFN